MASTLFVKSFVLLIVWLGQSVDGAVLNTYVSPDGKTYYNTPLMCDSGLLVSPYLKFVRQSYTARDDKDCCYLADSRNNCCFSVTECRCSTSVTCGVPTTTSTTTTTTTTTTPTTTTTTTPTTTTTTTTPTTTTTTTTPTTTTITTTKPSPTTTTTTPTTATSTVTTTTPITTTTKQPRKLSLCNVAKRILNGVKVSDSCTYPGIANITIANYTVCHAVLTTATVNGTFKTTFLTAAVCKKQISSSTTQQFDLEIGIQKYPVPSTLFRFYDGPNDTAFIDIADRYVGLLSDLGPCQTPACPYNNLTMNGLVDFNTCKMVSYGVTNTTGYTSQGETEVSVKYTPTGCTKLASVSNTSTGMCFTSISGLNIYCLGDSGAPVYCQATSNGEWILVGVTQVSPSCGTSPEIRVIPYPG